MHYISKLDSALCPSMLNYQLVCIVEFGNMKIKIDLISKQINNHSFMTKETIFLPFRQFSLFFMVTFL